MVLPLTSFMVFQNEAFYMNGHQFVLFTLFHLLYSFPPKTEKISPCWCSSSKMDSGAGSSWGLGRNIHGFLFPDRLWLACPLPRLEVHWDWEPGGLPLQGWPSEASHFSHPVLSSLTLIYGGGVTVEWFSLCSLDWRDFTGRLSYHLWESGRMGSLQGPSGVGSQPLTAATVISLLSCTCWGPA